MSDTDTVQGSGAMRRRQTPLLPEAGAAGTPLTIVIAVLAFMASVALSGYFMVSRAAADWTGDLAGTVTVQVKGATSDAIDEGATAAEQILKDSAGVSRVHRLSREESEALLEPWLGKGNLTADIPVPALITAEVTAERRQSLEPLRDSLAIAAPGATLDDHGIWNDRLVAAARRAQAIAFIIFMMVMSAAAAVIIFAARAGLAANRNIVEVMHLVGATDKFIANEVQQRYLSLGLRGGAVGALIAAVVLFLIASFNDGSEGFFLPNLGADPGMLLWLVFVPLALCAVAAVAARITVLKVLKDEL
ncbi:hypothetical protein [Parvularcula sp. LCG005]|uniref:cell division protein FtsX n=1 Tax=Parvularcula sp. LCG005 TaxID=3078805 RepID=UPI002943CA4A|nr:hypothetical protein [Parvularcula sp. LCG005]WOI53642.1 hypothetical protein RUI03_01280 [Parvularcula sp. LCG005]